MGVAEDGGQEGITERVAAIMAADAVGYSRLMADDEKATIAALDRARAVFVEHVEGNHGRVVDTAGDSVLAVFETTNGAVRASVAIQAGLTALNEGVLEPRQMLFRIGIHLGDIHEKADGTIYGDGVNVAARLEALSEAGGITVSDSVHGSIRDRLDVGFEFLGEHEGKNLRTPVRAFRMAGEQTAPQPSAQATDGPAPVRSEGPAIAVLPFANLSPDAEQAYFADGIVEEIITELSRFGDLRVLGRISTLQYKDHAVDVREIGHELDVDYVLEGSVRRGGDRLRVTAQLLDAKGGGHLWAETYERDLKATDIFDIQDDITAQVAGNVGGAFGAVARERMQHLRRSRTDNLAAYDSMRMYHQWLGTFDHTDYHAARRALESAVEIDPSYADAWAGLSSIYACEVTLFYELHSDSLDRALRAAERAVQLAPDHMIGHRTLAHARLLRREDGAFLEAAERTLSINPNDVKNMGIIGMYFCFTGEWDRGLTLLETATERLPRGATFSRVIEYLDHYRKGEFDHALTIANNSVGIGREADYLFVAAASGELRRDDEARASRDDLLRVCPTVLEYFSLTRHRAFDFVVGGLRKAGLDISEQPS